MSQPPLRHIAYRRVVELSHAIHSGIPQWPGDPPPEFATVASLETDGYWLRRFSLGEHSATHLNAPASFYPGGAGVEAYGPESLAAPAAVVDARPQAAANPDYALTLEAVCAWEAKHGPFPAGGVALLLTGWAARWGNPAAYLGLDAQSAPHFPGFGLEAAQYLLDERGAAGLGTDSPGLEPGPDATFAVNRMVLARPRLALESLTSLEQLPSTGATLVIGRLPLQGGSGSPAAVFAFIP